MPGVLVRSHGVFTFGEDAGQAVLSAVVLEEVAKMAYFTQSIRPEAARADDYICGKAFFPQTRARSVLRTAEKHGHGEIKPLFRSRLSSRKHGQRGNKKPWA